MHVITKIANIECTIPNNFQKKEYFTLSNTKITFNKREIKNT